MKVSSNYSKSLSSTCGVLDTELLWCFNPLSYPRCDNELLEVDDFVDSKGTEKAVEEFPNDDIMVCISYGQV